MKMNRLSFPHEGFKLSDFTLRPFCNPFRTGLNKIDEKFTENVFIKIA